MLVENSQRSKHTRSCWSRSLSLSHSLKLAPLTSLSVCSPFAIKFEFLVASLCPSIVGNHLVKAGLLLALFGGTTNDGLDEKNR